MTKIQTVDFSGSFFTWRTDTLKRPVRTASHPPPFTLNNARVPLDCWCQIRERRTGALEDFLLGVSCKTERVGVERDIWTDPNADFVPVVSKTRFLGIKVFDHADRRVTLYPPSLG